MILSYSLRLLFLCFASFVLVQAAAGLGVWFLGRFAIRFAERMAPPAAARFLLIMRILPVGIALASVLGIFAPSYLRFEQNLRMEQVGPAFLAVGAVGILVWAIALGHGSRIAVLSAKFTRSCKRDCQVVHIPGEPSQMLLIPGNLPFLAQSGIFHPQFLISDRLLHEFSREELSAALRHERAHWISRDNLKRLLFAFLPDIVPFWPSFESLERNWAKFAERAADDYVAISGDGPALSLAAALIRLARMGNAMGPSHRARWAPLATSPLGGSDDLSGRVQRLLRPATPTVDAASSGTRIVLGAASLVMAGCVATLLWPGMLFPVHEVLERLLH